MRIGSTDDPVQHDCVREGPGIFFRFARMRTDRPGYFRASGTAFVLVFLRRRKTKNLTQVLLLQAPDRIGAADAVVSLDDDRDLILEFADFGCGRRQCEGARQREAQMFVFGVAVERIDGRFEDMSCGGRTVG